MIPFRIEQLIPGFILRDKNGLAVAKAIEKIIEITNATILSGVNAITDVERMPEWRLDELAWEYNCLYDYSAPIEAKRRWIRDAVPLYSIYGTPDAIYKYLEGYFDSIELEEWWQYNADPYHFRITVSGEWTSAKEAWARRAIETAKNVRSVMDSIAVGSGCTVRVKGEGGAVARFYYPMTGPGLSTGTIPQENTIGKLADGLFVIATDARAHAYDYPMSGTRPEINTLGALRDDAILASADGTGYVYGYPPTGEDTRSGTRPQVNTIAAITSGDIRAAPDTAEAVFSYTPCGDKICGQDGL